jgi:hypothetical protein
MTTDPKYEFVGNLEPLLQEDEAKYSTFVAYLKERQKSAVITVDGNERTIFAYQPEANSSQLRSVKCFAKRMPATATSISNEEKSQASISAPRKEVVNDFLGSLLGKVENTVSFRSKTEVVAPKVDEVALLEERTRRTLSDFVADTTRNQFEFEPMDKSMRFVV